VTAVARVDPAAPGATVGRIAGRVDSPFEQAVVRFNASDAARTVAGLMRTLGTPLVSIGAAAGSSDEVRITVAWELCWYQWAVAEAVTELAKGEEIEQLDGSARQWNATAGQGGRLALGPPR
jgi:hypothetical protein